MPNSQQYSRNTVKSLKASITNKNQGGGNKKSGLISSTGGRPGLSIFRAGSTKAQRESTFCINQIGGVGRGVHQTKAPADGVNKCAGGCGGCSGKTDEQPKNIRFKGQNVNAFKAPFAQFQNTGNKCNSGYKYIPNSYEIDDFVEKVHSDKKRLLFAQWIKDTDLKIVNNVAAFLTNLQVQDGMKQLVETLTSHGAANTLSAIGLANSGERTSGTPSNGHEYQTGDTLGDEKYSGLEPTLPLLNSLTNDKLSQIAGQIYSLTSNKVIYGNSYVDEVVNFNQEWNKNQYDLTFNAKDKVYVDKAEGSLPNISSGLLISKIGSLYGLYYELITQLQTKLQEDAITLVNETATTSKNANGAVLKSANQPLVLDSSQSEDPGYFKLNDITIDKLNPLKVFKAERVKEDANVKFTQVAPAMDSYVPGVSSAYKGINDVFDATSSLALLNSNSPLYQSVNPLYQNTEAGTILKKAIEDTILSNQQLKESASVILSSDISPSTPIGTTLNAGGAVTRVNALRNVGGSVNDSLVAYQQQLNGGEELVEQYQNQVMVEYSKLVNLKSQIDIYGGKITAGKPPASTSSPWISGTGDVIELVPFNTGPPHSLNLTIADLEGIVTTTTEVNLSVPGGSTNSYSTPGYNDFRQAILNYFNDNLNNADFIAWTAAATDTQKGQSAGLVIVNYNILKNASGVAHDVILSMNDQFDTMPHTPEGIATAATAAAAGGGSPLIASYYQLEFNMTELYSKLVTQINAFNSLQNLVIKKFNLEKQFIDVAKPLLQSLGATHLISDTPTITDVRKAITQITNPNLVDKNGVNIINSIGDAATTTHSSQTVLTASEHDTTSPYKSSFGLSLELFLTSILVTQAYNGEIMKSMLQIANENGVGIDSVWIDVVNSAPSFTGNALDNYVSGGGNVWAKSSQATINHLKNLLQQMPGKDAEKEYNYFIENGLYAFNERLPTGFIEENGQPINPDPNAVFIFNDGFPKHGVTIGPLYLENGEAIYGAVQGGILKLVSVNYAGTATESRYLENYGAQGGKGILELNDDFTLADWQQAKRAGNDSTTASLGVGKGGGAYILGYNVSIPQDAFANTSAMVTMPEDLHIDFLDPVVVTLLKGDSLTKDQADELMNKISITKMVKTFMEFQYNQPAYINKFGRAIPEFSTTRGSEDYVFGSWTTSETGVPTDVGVGDDSSGTTNKVFLGYNGASISAAANGQDFKACNVLALNGRITQAAAAIANGANQQNKSGVYNYPYRLQVGLPNYQNVANASPWAQVTGDDSTIVTLIKSQIQDWLGIGSIVPTGNITPESSTAVACRFSSYPYKFITGRTGVTELSPFSDTRFERAKTSGLDKVVFSFMKTSVTHKTSSYISSQIDNISRFINSVTNSLSNLGHEQFTNNEVSMGGNTFALFDYRPFNFKSNTYDSSLAMCKLVSMTLKIFYQERILALSSRIKVFTDIIHSFNTSVNSLSVNTNEKLRYKIMIGFYFKFITQIKDQISMLKTLLKNDNYFSPVESSQDTATGGVARIDENTLSSYSISELDLIISFKNSPPIGFESASKKIIEKSIKNPASFIADENLVGGTEKNILGVNWLKESTITPRTNAVAAGEIGLADPVNAVQGRASNTNMPTLSSSTRADLITSTGGADSALVSAGFKSKELEVSIQNLDVSHLGVGAGDVVNAIFDLKGEAAMKKQGLGGGGVVTRKEDVIHALQSLPRILKSYGHSAVHGYRAEALTDTSINRKIKPSLSYPAINNLESGLNVQYTPDTISSSITLDPRYPPISSVSFSELENPLENISSLELFAEVGPEGNLVSSDTEINYTQSNTTLLTTLNEALSASSGRDNLGSLDNYLSYFQPFLIVKKADVSKFKSFGSLIQKLYSYGEIDGIKNQPTSAKIHTRPNLTNVIDTQGPKEFLQSLIHLTTKRIQNLKDIFPQTDYSSLLPFYQELKGYANELNGSEISNLGAYVNIQCPQNGLETGGETKSNEILPRYKDGGDTLTGPFQKEREKVNQNLGVGYISVDPFSEKSTASIKTIRVSASLPSNSLPSA